MGTEANPSSPHTRRRTSSFLKSLKSKLSTHSEEEEEEEEEEEKHSHILSKEDKNDQRTRSRGATVQRSQSMKTQSPDKKEPASSNSTTDRLDLARSISVPGQQKSSSAGMSTSSLNIVNLLYNNDYHNSIVQTCIVIMA